MDGFRRLLTVAYVIAGLCGFMNTRIAFAGPYVGWNVSVGAGAWGPAVYGPPGWRGGWAYGAGYGYPYGPPYFAPPVFYAPPVVYIPPVPLVLAAQPQATVWYFCEASGQYLPYVESCPAGWQVQPAVPPSSGVGTVKTGR